MRIISGSGQSSSLITFGTWRKILLRFDALLLPVPNVTNAESRADPVPIPGRPPVEYPTVDLRSECPAISCVCRGRPWEWGFPQLPESNLKRSIAPAFLWARWRSAPTKLL